MADIRNGADNTRGSARDRENTVGYPVFLDNPRKVDDRPFDADRPDHQLPLFRVVVNETDRRNPQLRIAENLVQDHDPGVAGANDNAFTVELSINEVALLFVVMRHADQVADPADRDQR